MSTSTFQGGRGCRDYFKGRRDSIGGEVSRALFAPWIRLCFRCVDNCRMLIVDDVALGLVDRRIQDFLWKETLWSGGAFGSGGGAVLAKGAKA